MLGVFIKMGQHMASLYVLPIEWTSTMRPLQDQCEPTPYEAVEALFQKDMGMSITDVFEEFDPNPIGVASLAQVHIGTHRESGKEVAVKAWPSLKLPCRFADRNLYSYNIHILRSSAI